jgi:hypothetical protein
MYSVNETLMPEAMARPFFSPPQPLLFALKDPPLRSFRRCGRHAVDFGQPRCCQEEAEPISVGECPRCYEQLRLKVRPEYEAKLKEVRAQFERNYEEAKAALEELEGHNQRLEG